MGDTPGYLLAITQKHCGLKFESQHGISPLMLKIATNHGRMRMVKRTIKEPLKPPDSMTRQEISKAFQMTTYCPHCKEVSIRCTCSSYSTVQGSDEITDQKHIAKFLGVVIPIDPTRPYVMNDRTLWIIVQQKAYVVENEWEFKDWLASNAGTVAMIESIIITQCIEIGLYKNLYSLATELGIECNDKTLNTALQAAILEVKGG
jgi:hypothetical protein